MFKILLAVVFTVHCVNGFHFFEHDYDRTPLGDAIDKASIKLLKEAYNAGSEKNVVSSPLGVMLLLSLYNSVAGPQSRDEITKLLGGGDYKQLVNSYGELSRSFAEMHPDYLTVANKIYVSNNYTLDEAFATTARQYRSEVDTIDFNDPPKAASIINKWSNEKTKGHIKSPVSDDAIDSNTAAALFNLIFFQGHWHVPFNASETKDEDFHVDSKTTVKKPMMRLEQALFYTESKELGAKMVELPYKETGIRMVIVLPDEVEGLAGVLEKVAQKGFLEDVFKMGPSHRELAFEMPKFEVRSGLDLNSLLPKVGVSKLFVEPATGLVKEAGVTIDKAFQEAFIKVDEEGATAGAFTGFIAVPTSSLYEPPPPMPFKVDHPFVFLILHQDKILFAGTYTH